MELQERASFVHSPDFVCHSLTYMNMNWYSEKIAHVRVLALAVLAHRPAAATALVAEMAISMIYTG